jgi:2'-5' RNA ligase
VPGSVTAVICTAFDEATDEAVYSVREVVRSAGIALPPRPPHRPHFSLSAARVQRGAELESVVDVARAVAGRHRPIRLRLSEVGRFGRAGVLWLGPRRVAELADLQRDVAGSLEAAGWPPAFGQRSDPGQWVAHCTLATRIAKPLLRQVQDAVRTAYDPIDALIDGLAVILVGGRGDIAHVRLSDQDP